MSPETQKPVSIFDNLVPSSQSLRGLLGLYDDATYQPPTMQYWAVSPDSLTTILTWAQVAWATHKKALTLLKNAAWPGASSDTSHPLHGLFLLLDGRKDAPQPNNQVHKRLLFSCRQKINNSLHHHLHTHSGLHTWLFNKKKKYTAIYCIFWYSIYVYTLLVIFHVNTYCL